MIAHLPVDQIRVDGSTQARVETSDTVVSEYADALTGGAQLPPVVVFDDGENVWLADGFHRLGAHIKANVPTIMSEVHFGSLSDAVLFAAGANGDHGLRRTNQDKRRATTVLLTHPTWSKWSDSQIARHCKVSSNFVGDVRRSIFNPINDAEAAEVPRHEVRTVTRNGVTYEQNTTKIGKTATPPAESTVTEAVPASPIEARAADSVSAPAINALATGPAPEDIRTPSGPIPSGQTGEGVGVPMSEVEQLREQLAELAADLEKTIAANVEMGRVFEADDRLQAAMGEVTRYKAAATSAKQSLDSKMGENNELIRAVKRLTRDVEREKRRADDAERQLAQMRSAA